MGPALFLALACSGPKVGSPSSVAQPVGQVRHRPVPNPGDALAVRLTSELPEATWDAGLAVAAGELLSLAADRHAWIDPITASLVSARAGFPGQARFARELNGGAWPNELLNLVGEVEDPVDVALVKRTYADGLVLWILAWSPHLADIDPLPLRIGLDGSVGVRVDMARPGEARLFLAPPMGPVEELALTDGVARWVDLFQVPGPHRLEVVVDRGRTQQVVALFSVFVDSPPPRPTPLGPPTVESRTIATLEADLLTSLNELRAGHGLRPLAAFPLFANLAREHSAIMAAAGKARHQIAGMSPGVPAMAEDLAHPRAIHHENVAMAWAPEEAQALVVDSPAHLRNFLCEACTHAAIGVAREPRGGKGGRLFFTWELLEFPQGVPRKIDRLNRR